MKIERIKEERLQTIESIHDGEAFEACGNSWMATSEYCNSAVTDVRCRKCVRLSDGYVDEFVPSKKVKPINAKVVIE